MKRLLLFCSFVFAFFASTHAQSDCVRQENIPATYEEEDIVIVIPPVKVMVQAAVLDTVIHQVCVRDATFEEMLTCDENGIFTKCTKTIPALYENVKYVVELAPAQYVEYGGYVKKVKKQKLVRNGYIKTYSVPCAN